MPPISAVDSTLRASGPVAAASFDGASTASDQRLAERIERLERELGALRGAFDAQQPVIRRLSQVEAEIGGIVRQIEGLLGLQPASNDTPAMPTTTYLPTTARETPPTARATATSAPAATGRIEREEPAGTFYLHLASYLSTSMALDNWPRYRDAHPVYLADLSAHPLPFNSRSGERYTRLTAGPLTRRSEAERRCSAISASGRYCRVITAEPD